MVNSRVRRYINVQRTPPSSLVHQATAVRLTYFCQFFHTSCNPKIRPPRLKLQRVGPHDRSTPSAQLRGEVLGLSLLGPQITKGALVRRSVLDILGDGWLGFIDFFLVSGRIGSLKERKRQYQNQWSWDLHGDFQIVLLLMWSYSVGKEKVDWFYEILFFKVFACVLLSVSASSSPRSTLSVENGLKS